MKSIAFVFLFLPLFLFAQKKPLDHSVYDGWQSIGERAISNDGNWVVYSVVPQEGDGELFIQSVKGDGYKLKVPRGYNALITEDSRFVVFRIKPLFKDTREARIKKKRPDDFPKDSIGILELGKDKPVKLPKVRSFKMPEKSFGWVAYQKEKETVPSRTSAPTQKTVDSLKRTIDSLVLLVTTIKNEKSGNRDLSDTDDDPAALSTTVEGSDLVLRRLADGKEQTFKNVVDYFFNPLGQRLVMRVSRNARDSSGANAVIVYDLQRARLDTVLKGGNDFKNFVWTEEGSRLAFVAERDTTKKPLLRYYDLYVYQPGFDSAVMLVNRNTPGMNLGMTVSENGVLSFSKSGRRLFFGTAPIPPLPDTTLVDIDLVKVDVWHYNDDYLQTQQLFQLNNELKRNYTAVYDFTTQDLVQLGSKYLPTIIPTNEGDGDIFIGVTDTGRRVASQWSGNTKKDIYAVQVKSGLKTLVRKNHDGQVYPSSTGNFILLYDNKLKNYFAWSQSGLKNITSGIRLPLYNEENDVPDDPNPYGIMGWHAKDSFVYVYDRYDVWKLDPLGQKQPVRLTRGRENKVSYRYLRLDPNEKYVQYGQPLYYRLFSEDNKFSGIAYASLKNYAAGNVHAPEMVTAFDAHAYNSFQKAKNANAFLYSREDYSASPDLYFSSADANSIAATPGGHSGGLKSVKLSALNPQQEQYNWGTAELYKWKAFNGKPATGVLYKPEDFDPSKKYPMLIYFYERVSDNLYNYIPPAPTPSRLNIPFFVSRGYLVFTPDIRYTKGHPGKDAYNYIVSGAQSLAANKWVDAKNMGLQGQSWGGYQVAYLVTATNMFRAAWAGAPVVNMFSAYGGIRWESGNNRQSQYEKGQSRIGATPWQRPDLYIENSPLFHLQQITTPLVIMSNDADGAVPWYQGIEFFTAMRRLGKKVWLLNYNGEAHNLVERKNRKDIQVREQEYFDWLLKGARPAKWITEGVPAVKKGKDWGLELVDE